MKLNNVFENLYTLYCENKLAHAYLLETNDIQKCLIDLKTFVKNIFSEIENIAKAGPIAYADYYIFNNGTINEFYERLKVILAQI